MKIRRYPYGYNYTGTLDYRRIRWNGAKVLIRIPGEWELLQGGTCGDMVWARDRQAIRRNGEGGYENLSPCGHCGLLPTCEGHDGCLGKLPGVWGACCGHGNERYRYVMLETSEVVLRRGDAARWVEANR